MNFELYKTDYYRWLLSSNDKTALYTLCRMVLTRNNKYYGNGLLVVNAKLETIAWESGMHYGTLKDSMKRLDYMGVILKLKKCAKNNRYLLGFRTDGEDRLYFLSHLAYKYADILDRRISKQKSELGKKQSPVLEKSDYRLDSTHRDHILEHFENANNLLNERIEGKTIPELLFGRVKIYRKPLPRNVTLGAVGAL